MPYIIRVGFMEEVALGINFKATNICLLAEGKAFLLGRSSIIPLFTSAVLPSSTQAISAAPGQLEAILATCHPNACPSLTLLFSSKADEHILWPSHNSCPPSPWFLCPSHSSFSHFLLRPHCFTHQKHPFLCRSHFSFFEPSPSYCRERTLSRLPLSLNKEPLSSRMPPM